MLKVIFTSSKNFIRKLITHKLAVINIIDKTDPANITNINQHVSQYHVSVSHKEYDEALGLCRSAVRY